MHFFLPSVCRVPFARGIMATLVVAAAFAPALTVAEPLVVGVPTVISAANQRQTHSAIEYGSVDNRFLVVWQDERQARNNGRDIFGQVVDADGTPFGTAAAISTAPNHQATPLLAYNPVDNQFLVVWADWQSLATNGLDIYGQIVAADGTLVGGNFPIATATENQDRPQIAFDPVSRRYLVAWQDRRNPAAGWDVYGQLVDATGALVGGNFPIGASQRNQWRPRASYSSVDQRFVVFWQDDRNKQATGVDVYGQFVASDGSLVGTNFIISDVPGDQHRPTVAYDTEHNQFFLTWADCRNNLSTCTLAGFTGHDIYGQLIAGDGTLVGDSVPVSIDPAPQVRPGVAYSAKDRLFLVVWTDERDTGSGHSAVYMQTVSWEGTLIGPNKPLSSTQDNEERAELAYNPVTNRFIIVFTQAITDGGDVFGQTVQLLPATWSSFRHDSLNTGRSPYRGPATMPEIKWSVTTGSRVWPSPAIGEDGTVYAAAQDSKIRAIRPDGTVLWTFTTGGAIFSSPAIHPDGTVYFGSDDAFLYALDPATGSVKWSFQTGDKILAPPAVSADGTTVFIGSNDNNLYALDATSGALKWAFTAIHNVPGKPALGLDGRIYFGSNTTIYALDATGALLWTFPVGGWLGASPSIDPVDGTVYYASWDDTLYALNPDGTLKWSLTTGGRIESSAAIGPDRTVYIGSVDEYIYAINPDGTIKWSYLTTGCPTCTCHIVLPLHPACNEVESSVAVDADNVAYVGSHDNHVYAINPDGTLRWRFQVGDQVNSSPSIGKDGRIYFGSRDKKIYAIGAP